MRRFALLFALFAGWIAQTFAYTLHPVTGKVIDSENNPLEFANVIFSQEQRQVKGLATDSEGRFSTSLPDGLYTVDIRYLGYKDVTFTLDITATTDCGDIKMQTDENRLDEVVVTSQVIKREADRFVVDVANAASALGKDGIELLQMSPGVWVSDDKISINGKEGSKVYINDRELKMESSQLLIYLRSLRTEDIQKIEVIPQSGADYDADSSSGIIKITLRRQRNDGMMGSVSFDTGINKLGEKYSPNASINYHKDKFDLYLSTWGWFSNTEMQTREQTKYNGSQSELNARSENSERYRNYGFRAGTVYELNPRHSIGLEAQYYENREPNGNTGSISEFATTEGITSQQSRYHNSSTQQHLIATFNYIYKLDTLGSTLKLIADYNHRNHFADNDMQTTTTTPLMVRDSIYRDLTDNRYDILTASLAMEKNLSRKWQLKAGVKYTRNDMHNLAKYEYLADDAWSLNSAQSFDIDYTENIAAAYAIATARLGRFSAVVGLRGEYTSTHGRGGEAKQNYFSLFPNANLSYSLTKDGKHNLIGQYARTISRPGFWSLTPRRTQISDYTYQIGNPNLDPSYTNSITLTYVLHYKYSFSVGASLSRDQINQAMEQDPTDPEVLRLTWANYGKINHYFASANIPAQITKWWSLNANLTYIYFGQSQYLGLGATSDKIDYQHLIQANAQTTFTLPKKFMIDVSYFGMNSAELGNVKISPQHRLSFSLKKRFFDDRLLVSLSADNVLQKNQTLTTKTADFTRRMVVYQDWNTPTYGIRIAYTFKSGKAFNNRSVESDSSEQTSRLN